MKNVTNQEIPNTPGSFRSQGRKTVIQDEFGLGMVGRLEPKKRRKISLGN